jgi:hypothetical protein
MQHGTGKAAPRRVIGIAQDARIETPAGGVRAADLRAGDAVRLWDGGRATVIWRGVLETALTGGWHPEAPVRIPAGAMGAGLPARDTAMPPHQRVLLDTSQGPALGALKALTGWRGIAPVEGSDSMAFVALLLDRHGVLVADGIAVESFYPGRLGLSLLPGPDADAIEALIPGVGASVLQAYGAPATRILNGFELDTCLEMLGQTRTNPAQPPMGDAAAVA